MISTDLWNLMGTVSSLGVITIFAAAIYKMGYAQGMWQGKRKAERNSLQDQRDFAIMGEIERLREDYLLELQEALRATRERDELKKALNA